MKEEREREEDEEYGEFVVTCLITLDVENGTRESPSKEKTRRRGRRGDQILETGEGRAAAASPHDQRRRQGATPMARARAAIR